MLENQQLEIDALKEENSSLRSVLSQIEDLRSEVENLKRANRLQNPADVSDLPGFVLKGSPDNTTHYRHALQRWNSP